jgi:hypothetical protein
MTVLAHDRARRHMLSGENEISISLVYMAAPKEEGQDARQISQLSITSHAMVARVHTVNTDAGPI